MMKYICLLFIFTMSFHSFAMAADNRIIKREPALVVIMTPPPVRPLINKMPVIEVRPLAVPPSEQSITNKDVSPSNSPAQMTEILRHVYQTNPTLLATRAELLGIHELYPQALAGYRPSINVEANIYNKDVDSDSVGTNDGTTTQDVVFSLSQPLYRGGRTVAETAKANSLIKAAYAGLQQNEQFIFLQTITVIADMVRDRALLQLRENNVTLLNEEATAANARMEAGELTITDTKQAAARLARATSEKIFSENNLQSSAAQYEQITGSAPPDNLVFPPPIFTFPNSAQEMMALAEQNNPEIKVSLYSHAAADHNVDVIFRELLPQLSAFLTYSSERNPQPGGISDTNAGTIGLRASIPLYEAGATRSRVREAKQTAKQREIEIEETKRRIIQRIMDDRQSLATIKAEITSRDKEIEAAEAARDGVSAEAKLGARTVLDVLDAEQELLDAKASRIIAERNTIVSHYALAADLGLLRPENLGLGDLRYNPAPHYRAMGKRILSMDPDINETDTK